MMRVNWNGEAVLRRVIEVAIGGLKDMAENTTELAKEKSPVAARHGGTNTLSFVSAYSHAFTLVETVVELDIDDNPFTFYLNDEETNVPGTWFAQPTFVINATNGASAVILTNTITNESLTYSSAVPAGYTLQIDCASQVVQVDSGAGLH